MFFCKRLSLGTLLLHFLIREGNSISISLRKCRLPSLYMQVRSDANNVVVVGVAADSGCGKSTFMRRLTKVFGGKNPGPLGGGFGSPGGWETNTLVSDRATVLCLDDYHLNDRQGRKKSGKTALNIEEQNFDLMAEHIKDLKNGRKILKPIYNHVNGTLDAPEIVTPTPIVIIEGLHPMADKRVRDLLDFTIYLDVSDDVKFEWKIQRDMKERGWSYEQVKMDIEKRKPDFEEFVAPQQQYADCIISIEPSKLMIDGRSANYLNVKMIQKFSKIGLSPMYMLDTSSAVSVKPLSVSSDHGVRLRSYPMNNLEDGSFVMEMDGKLSEMADFNVIEQLLTNTGAKMYGEVSAELEKIGSRTPGSMDGTGLFQTIAAFKLREYYEKFTGTNVAKLGQKVARASQ